MTHLLFETLSKMILFAFERYWNWFDLVLGFAGLIDLTLQLATSGGLCHTASAAIVECRCWRRGHLIATILSPDSPGAHCKGLPHQGQLGAALAHL